MVSDSQEGGRSMPRLPGARGSKAGVWESENGQHREPRLLRALPGPARPWGCLAPCTWTKFMGDTSHSQLVSGFSANIF